jgi:predicted small metal-binding protein
MGRKFIDCLETPSVMNCSIAISADSEEELIDAAVQHAVSVHGHKDTQDFRTLIKGAIREGTPPPEVSPRTA